MKRAFTLFAVFGLVAAACGSGPDAAPPTSVAQTSTTFSDPRIPVIFDYSPTVSDVGALVFLAVHPDVRLVAVTLPGTGEGHCSPGVEHTRGVLVALGLDDVPVACAPDRGYGELNPFPEDWRASSDSMDLPLAAPNETRSAPELIAGLLAASAQPVEIVAVGPLTNVALVLDQYPELADRIAGITIMGGAVDVPGNVPRFAWESANEHAEVNFWVDPAAAARVIASDVPITLVPLDATDFVPADAKFRSALLSTPLSPASGLLGGVWRDAPEWIQGGYYLWDELAAAVLAEPSLVEFETRPLVVDVGDDAVAGWSREDPAGMPVRVAVRADRVAFETLFLTTVLERPASIDRLVASAEERTYFARVGAMSTAADAAQEEIFLEASAALGYDVDTAEEAWLDVVLAAAPAIFAGPFTELLAGLRSVTPPESVAPLHLAWVGALADVLAHQGEVLEALEAAIESGAESELPYFTPFVEACAALSDFAVNRGLPVDLAC